MMLKWLAFKRPPRYSASVYSTLGIYLTHIHQVCSPLIVSPLISVRKSGSGHFTLLVASTEAPPQVQSRFDTDLGEITLIVEYGDFAKPLQKVVRALEEVDIPLFSIDSKAITEVYRRKNMPQTTIK
jgi:hypothetical protein